MPATGERRLTYACNAVRDCYARKACIVERLIAYARYAVGYCYTCKARTTVERRIAYACHTSVIRNNAVLASSNKSLACRFYYAVACRMIYRISAFDRYTFKMPATGERRLTYARNAVRNHYARNVLAISERTITYARHAVRDCYA